MRNDERNTVYQIADKSQYTSSHEIPNKLQNKSSQQLIEDEQQNIAVCTELQINSTTCSLAVRLTASKGITVNQP